MNIFISYRRDDSIVITKLIRNELVTRFGVDHVFMDIDDIGYGDDFVQAIDTQLPWADVVLVVIGPHWAEMLEKRLRGDDWVRHEVASALKLNADSKGSRPRVIPVLVGGAILPINVLHRDIAGLQRLVFVSFDELKLNASLDELEKAIRMRTFQERVEDLLEELWGRKRALIRGGLIGLGMFLAGWVALFDFFGIDTRLATATMALASIGRASEPAPWSGQVVLLGIDKGTEQSVGRQTDSSWRVEHARVIEKVAAAGARTLAFDITLDAPGTEQQNVSIEQALQNTHETMPVVFGVAERNDDSPLPKFASHAHWGIACAGLKLGRAYLIPVAARRDVVPPPVESAPRAERYIVRPSLALAAFSGGGKVEPFDEWARTAQVTVMKPELLSQQVAFFVAETVASTQSGCTAIAKGDRVAYQLLDPLSLPTLREPPQRLPYESVLASEADTLAKLKGKIVLVGEQLPGKDTYTLSNGVERWGVELIAHHIDALAREKAIRSIGGLVQSLITLALGLLGAYVAFRLRRWTAARRAAVLFGLGALFVVAVVWWYRVEQQLIGLPYGIGALALGAWVASRLGKRKSI